MKKFLLFCFAIILVGVFLTNDLRLKDCVFAEKELNYPEISIFSAYVCDFYTGKVVYEKNADKRKPIASMTKVVGLAIIFDELKKGTFSLDDETIISEHAADTGGSSAFLDEGSKYKVEDLIKSIIIASANDSMVALAEFVSGSEKSFVNKMNDFAKENGMINTRFENATGLPSVNAYSTAKDIVMGYKEIVNEPIYIKYSKIWIDELVHPSGRKTELVNTNKLIKSYKKINGGKTGYTNEAKYCFVGNAIQGDINIIASVLGAESSKIRFDELKMLYEFAFNNYTNKLIVDTDKPVAQINIKNAKSNKINAFSCEKLYNFQKNNENQDVKVVTKFYKNIAPISPYSVVGKVYLVDNTGIVICESNLIVKEKIEKLSVFDCFDKIVTAW